MESLKSSAEYAGEQCVLLLQCLDEAKTHSQKERALKVFKKYITEYKPDVYDDDVTVFFIGGDHNGEKMTGLLSWCGQKSSKHNGCLKRSAQNVIALVSWLLSFSFKKDDIKNNRNNFNQDQDDNDENTFLTVFLRLHIDDYSLMELSLHILPSADTGSDKRGGSANDAFDILSLLLRDHKDEDGQNAPLDLISLLHQDEARKMFSKWLQESAIEEERSGMAGLKSENTTNPATKHSLAAQTNEERRAHELQELVKSVRRGAPTSWDQIPIEERALPAHLLNGGSNPTSPSSPISDKKIGMSRRRKKSIKKVKRKSTNGDNVSTPTKASLANMAESEVWSDKEGSTESEDSFNGGGSTDDDIDDEDDDVVKSPTANQVELPGSEDNKLDEDDALSLSLTTSLTKSKHRRRGAANSTGDIMDVGKEAEVEEDPLGLNEIDLVAIERGRLRNKDGSAGGGGARRRGSLIGFNAKKQLLSTLRSGVSGRENEGKLLLTRSPSSGDGSGGGVSNDDKESEEKGKEEIQDGSILPTSTDFDAVSFLVLVHGQASLTELIRGRAYLQAQVGSGKSSLEELVRKNFDTFIRSADSIEHFSLAFHHVTGGAFQHNGNHLTASKGVHKKGNHRRGSFFGSDAHVNMLQQTVSLLDRVDLNALGDLVVQSKEDARDAFGLLLSRGNRLRAFRSARACLAGYSSLLDAPNAMRSAILARPYPRFADAVAHWKRIKIQLKKLNVKSNDGGKFNWRKLKMNLAPKAFEKSATSIAGAGLLKHVGEQADVVGQEIRNCLRDVLASPPPSFSQSGMTDLNNNNNGGGDGNQENDVIMVELDDEDYDEGVYPTSASNNKNTTNTPLHNKAESRRRKEHRAHMSRVLKAAILLVEVGAENDEEEKINGKAFLHNGTGKKGVSRLKELAELLPVTYRQNHKENHKKEGEDIHSNIGLCTWALALSPHLLSFAHQTRHFLKAIEGNATSFDALDHLMSDDAIRYSNSVSQGFFDKPFDMTNDEIDNNDNESSDNSEHSDDEDNEDNDENETNFNPMSSTRVSSRVRSDIGETDNDGGGGGGPLRRSRGFNHSTSLPIPVMTSAMLSSQSNDSAVSTHVSGSDRVGYMRELANQLKRFLPLLSVLTTKIHLDKLNMGNEIQGSHKTDRRGSLFKSAKKKGLSKFDPTSDIDPLSPTLKPDVVDADKGFSSKTATTITAEGDKLETSAEDLAKVSKLFGMSKFGKKKAGGLGAAPAPTSTHQSAPLKPSSPSLEEMNQGSIFREFTSSPTLELIKCAEKVRDDLLQHAKGSLLLVMNEIELILLGISSFESHHKSNKNSNSSSLNDISVNDQLVFNISRMPLSKRALRCEHKKLSITSSREAIHIIADLYEGILCLDESISKKNAEVDGTRYSGHGNSWLHDVLDKVKNLLTVSTDTLIQQTFKSVNSEFSRFVTDPVYFKNQMIHVHGDYSDLFKRASLGRVKKTKQRKHNRKHNNKLGPSEINHIIHSGGVSIPDLLSGSLAAFLAALEPITRCRPSWFSKLVEECTASMSHTAITYLSPNYDIQGNSNITSNKHKHLGESTMKVFEFSKNKSYETYELICDLISYGPLRYNYNTYKTNNEAINNNNNGGVGQLNEKQQSYHDMKSSMTDDEYDDIVMKDLKETELSCLITAGGREVNHHISKNNQQLRALAKTTLKDLHQANAIYSENESNLVNDGEHFDHRIKLSSASNAFAISGIILPHYIKIIENIFPPLSEEQQVSHFLNDDTDSEEDEIDELCTPTALQDANNHHNAGANNTSNHHDTPHHHSQHHLLLHEIAMSRIVAYCFTAQSHHHRVLDIRIMIEHGWLSHSRQNENMRFSEVSHHIETTLGIDVMNVMNAKLTNSVKSRNHVYRVPSYISSVLLSLALARSELDESLGTASLSFSQLNASYAFGHIAGACLAALIVAARLRLDANSTMTNETQDINTLENSSSGNTATGTSSGEGGDMSIDGSIDMKACWLSPSEAKTRCAEFSFLVNTLLDHSFEATKLPHGPNDYHFETLKNTCEDTIERLKERSEEGNIQTMKSGEEEKEEFIIDQCVKLIEEQTRTYLMCF